MPIITLRHMPVAAMSLCLVVLCSSACRADDCGPAIFAYENRVVFYSCDKTGALGLNVVVLEEASDLKISGHVPVNGKRGFDAIARHKDQVLILTWDLLQIFDTTDPAHPTPAAKFTIKNQGKFQGYDRIERKSDNSFFVLSGRGTGELTFAGDPLRWTYTDVERTPAQNKIAQAEPPESRLSRDIQDVTPLLETAKFRFELVWKNKVRPGEVLHREFLCKVDKTTHRSISSLLLGERLETID